MCASLAGVQGITVDLGAPREDLGRQHSFARLTKSDRQVSGQWQQFGRQAGFPPQLATLIAQVIALTICSDFGEKFGWCTARMWQQSRLLVRAMLCAACTAQPSVASNAKALAHAGCQMAVHRVSRGRAGWTQLGKRCRLLMDKAA